MASLARNLRKDLEKTVKKARRVAETGARKVLEQLGVHHHEPYGFMSPEQRTLRNRLRAHGRQLGDRRDPQRGTQAIGRLVQECAYEHWHRMLFARFLAETDLLIEPQSGVAITLEECQELARDEGADWLELASGYAEQMLPQIFRKDDPVLAVTLPPESRSELEDLLKALPSEVFTADDSLGWVYQFWQVDAKKAINESEKKIGADELPAVTQLFTEDYMVLFLLHNTLGAWWAGKVLAERPELATTAKSENELRGACKVGDVEWTYLRFVRDEADDGTEGPWRPAAGTFEGWPSAAKEVTMLDPCMGSGHFLVFALPILVAFRMAEEGLSSEAAINAVLKDNLFGLEIDQRCTQIAAFNLALAAWRIVGYRQLPRLNLACSGLSIGVSKAEWLRLAEKAAMSADPDAKRNLLGVEENLLTAGLEARVKNGLEGLYDLFAMAPCLGSLIDPHRSGGDIFSANFAQLEPLFRPIVSAAENDDLAEMAVAAQGMAKAAELLQQQFVLVATNVPYLGRGKQGQTLAEFCAREYSTSKTDLATVMVSRLVKLLRKEGTVASVTPQGWLFLGSYQKFRKELLRKCKFNIVSALGPRAFETISGEVVNAILIAFSRSSPEAISCFSGLDCNEEANPGKKAEGLRKFTPTLLNQARQIENPDSRIVLAELASGMALEAVAQSYQGIKTGDDSRYRRFFWELNNYAEKWRFIQSTVNSTQPFGGLSGVVDWSNEGHHIARLQGLSAHGRIGCAVSQMSDLPAAIYLGGAFDSNVSAIVPKHQEDGPAIWAFCASEDYPKLVKKLEPSMKANNAVLAKVPFDLAHWKAIAARKYPDGLPKPYSESPTQFVFHGHPRNTNSGCALQVAVSRFCRYRWPGERDLAIPLSQEALDCVSKAAKLNTVDDDDIVCLTATKGEAPAHERLNALLADAFRAEWSAAKLASLLAEVNYAGKTLDDWLRDGFFEQHCALFQNRPFVWHIWDGRRDGFHALVNYHRLAASGGEGRRTLEKLIYSYLGDWIDQQRADQKAGVEGADGRLATAEHLRSELTKILRGEPPYDISVRWKPLHQQPIGWEPDIDDGVRMNIRPFMTARPLNARAKTACILRTTPKSLKWDKDRGKEPMREKEEHPWFWGWDPNDPDQATDFEGGGTFDGNRWNNLHYTRTFKENARARQAFKVRGKS